MKFIEWLHEKDKMPSRTLSPSNNSDDEPLAVRRRSLQPEPKAKQTSTPKKGKPVDWFKFFLEAGCDMDDCSRYADSFERDKIDESILPDINQQTMRSLGLREGDIIRVSKAIAQRLPNQKVAAAEEQLRKDEEYARKLQEDENTGRASPRRQTASPGLFAGPGGALKNNTRRGRPQSSKTAPPASVDLQSISTASTQIQRQDSPSISRVTSPASANAGGQRSAPAVSGFDDDAWTNRPSSTQPLTPTPPVAAARPNSVPPTQTTLVAPSLPPASTPPVVQAAASPAKGLAQATESDVFEQLARLSALRTQTPAAASPGPPSAAPVTSPPIVSPPGYQNGMGMGPSPVPIGQIQAQPTGLPQNGAPRGPFAPVPHNQSLLQPLVPTQTGFNGFVPTRPSSNPPPPIPQQPSFLSTQPTGFQPPPQMQMQPQPTGFPGNPSPAPQSAFPNTQQTGFNPNVGNGGLVAQQTGFPGSAAGPMMAQTTSYPGAYGSGPFAGGRAFGPPLQPSKFCSDAVWSIYTCC
jgi:actin cytoskeleton-regulatory complex protein SLA1